MSSVFVVRSSTVFDGRRFCTSFRVGAELCSTEWCFCCGGVSVAVVFLWWCGGVVVFLWWCSCGGVFVVVWWCFCGGVFVLLCGGVFVVVFLWWCFCGDVLAVVFFVVVFL